MKLYYDCPNCKEEREIESLAQSREDLAKAGVGNSINLHCYSCDSFSDINVNHIYASLEEAEQAMPYLIAALIAGVLIFISDGMITIILLLLPLVAYLIIKNKLEDKLKTFNSNRV